jgi:CheY-like chemotaxis protein
MNGVTNYVTTYPKSGSCLRSTGAGLEELPVEQRQSSPKPRILFVDDDALTRSTVERLLVSAGYTVDTASDGAEAWQLLNDGVYSLLITDIRMPRMTGLELVAKVRMDGMRIPAILISSSVSSLYDPTIRWLDLSGRLTKPLEIGAFLRTISGCLSSNYVHVHSDALRSLLERVNTMGPYPNGNYAASNDTR